MRHARRLAVILFGALTLGVGGAEAQQHGGLSITPFVGGLVPTSSLGQLRVGGLTATPTVFEGEMKTAGALGARVGYRFGSRWGLEGSYFYSTSDFRSTGLPFSATVDASVQGGTLEAFYQLTTEGTGTDLLITAGVAGVSHGGPAFQLARDQFDVGGTIGAGLHIVMTQQLTLRFDGDLLVYPWSAGPGFPNALQTDLLMTIGVGFSFNR
ncbi:MAG: outer membrane beta-barrel protein [Gemmatimonadales bacterium]